MSIYTRNNVLAIVLSLIVIFTMTACGDGSGGGDESNSTTSPSDPVTAPVVIDANIEGHWLGVAIPNGYMGLETSFAFIDGKVYGIDETNHFYWGDYTVVGNNIQANLYGGNEADGYVASTAYATVSGDSISGTYFRTDGINGSLNLTFCDEENNYVSISELGTDWYAFSIEGVVTDMVLDQSTGRLESWSKNPMFIGKILDSGVNNLFLFYMDAYNAFWANGQWSGIAAKYPGKNMVSIFLTNNSGTGYIAQTFSFN